MTLINKNIKFNLPLPWEGKIFETTQIGSINYLVGPNGSGKSRFAEQLKKQFNKSRILGTDRLSGMEQANALRIHWGDRFSIGFPKEQFQSYKNIGVSGYGIDTFVLLEERMDLRIQVEATLSHLFNRNIRLEWDSGNLVAKATIGNTGNDYRLDRDECHGIKELLVLLTNLYNDEYSCLIIDEPELNLHPQFQAFFMQEVRKIAGDPSEPKKKIIFLITHSPFILDFKSIDDIKSIISFNLDHSVPKQVHNLEASKAAKLASLIPRLNVHHKQLFFSDNPVFVEGMLDAQFISILQEARGVSVAGAGSCIIDVGGCEEVNIYLELCIAFAKKAYFLYDLDSLFNGNLRSCIKDDNSIQSFLATAGVTNDFSKYCGELDQKIHKIIDKLLDISSIPEPLSKLAKYLQTLGNKSEWRNPAWAKARVAIITTISYEREICNYLFTQAAIEEIQGRLAKICEALIQKNIILLSEGTIERYLPKFNGDYYQLPEEAKRNAIRAEIEEMSKGLTSTQLRERYTRLFDAVCALPSKVKIDIDRVLRSYLGKYIHDLQNIIVNNPDWQCSQVQDRLNLIQSTAKNIFSLRKLEWKTKKEFEAVISVNEMLGEKKKIVKVDHHTNAGMGEFKIESEPSTS